MTTSISNLLEKQRQFFATGQTLPHAFRRAALVKLLDCLAKNEDAILQALAADLKKPQLEAYVSDVASCYSALKHTIKHLQSWMQPQKVSTPFVLFPGRSYVVSAPYGSTLIIGAWNYPFMLTLVPMIGALAAGNTAIVKPSELTPACSVLLKKIIADTFPEHFVAAIEGDAQTSQALLKEKFDYIFFTGSTAVGKIVAKAAAENLTPVTLELGGKSPCIVDAKIDLQVAARRIAWGKFFNAGQSCVAPDYVLVHESVKENFLTALKDQVHKFYMKEMSQKTDYACVVDQRHGARLDNLIHNSLDVEQGLKIIFGGEWNKQTRCLQPTVLTNVSFDHAVMKEEIFGPILPVISYKTDEELIKVIQNRPHPLALYVFSNDTQFTKKIIYRLRFGGGCINDTMVHISNENLPFGGVGESGMGRYHGQASFETFSYKKSIYKNTLWFDIPLRYPPYRNKLNLIKKIMK